MVKEIVSFVVSKVSYFSKNLVLSFLENCFSYEETCILSSRYWNNGISPTPWKYFQRVVQLSNVSSSESPTITWDTERLLCKSEFVCSNKIRSHKKSFAGFITNYTWRVKKLHVILIFIVGHHWLDKLVYAYRVKLFTVRITVYVERRLAEKAIYSTRQTVGREEHAFWFFQNVCKLPILISSFFQWYHIIHCPNSAFPWGSNSKRPKL